MQLTMKQNDALVTAVHLEEAAETLDRTPCLALSPSETEAVQDAAETLRCIANELRSQLPEQHQ